jgi:hypothetical protein
VIRGATSRASVAVALHATMEQGAAEAVGQRDERPWLIIRPEIPWLRYAGSVTFWAAVLLVGSWLALLRRPAGATSLEVIGGIVGAFLLFGAARLCLVSRFSRLRAGGGELEFTNMVGRARSFPRDSIRKVVIAHRSLVAMRYATTVGYYLFLDQNGTTQFKLPTKWWPQEGIDAVGQALGVLVTGTFGELDGPAFRRQFPGAISWVSAHPLVVGSLLFIPLLIGVVILVSIVTGQSLVSA